MALFWAYVPEPDELEILARVGSPDAAGEELKQRKSLFVGAYVELQAHCSRKKDRYLDRFELLAMGAPDEEDGEFAAWVVEAVCTPLPNRPPLVHVLGDPAPTCPFEGCLDSADSWPEGADFRLCLTR